MLTEELPHHLGDRVAFGFQSKVAGIDQVVLDRLEVALVRFGPGGGEDRVVFTPRDQHRRLMRTEIFLPFRVQRRVAAVVEEQVELNFVVPLSVE